MLRGVSECKELLVTSVHLFVALVVSHSGLHMILLNTAVTRCNVVKSCDSLYTMFLQVHVAIELIIVALSTCTCFQVV